MNLEGAASKARVPAGGFFRVGAKSPVRTRRGQSKPAIEKRKKIYKQGIKAHENRRLRSRKSLDCRKDKKKMALKKLRTGLSNPPLPNPAFFGVSPSSRSASNSAVAEKLVGVEKRYTGTAKEKLIAFYTDHNHLKLGSVDATLAKYAGKEDTLFVKLANKYRVNPAVFSVDYPPAIASNGTTGAFEAYATGKKSFGSWTPSKEQSGGFGKQSSSSNTGSKGRSTINSLKTYTDDGFRASSDSDGEMECD